MTIVASTAAMIVRSPLKVGRRTSRRGDATEWDIDTRNRSMNSVVLVARFHGAINVVVESEAFTATQLVEDLDDAVKLLSDGESLRKIRAGT